MVTSSSTQISNVQLGVTDSILLTMESLDLSEDMSVLSSNNDEVLVMLYEYLDSAELKEPIGVMLSKFDKVNQTKTFSFPLSRRISNSKLPFLLIEQDSETPVEQIDPIFRVHHQSIITEFNSNNYLQIEKYLGDEDLLGVQIINDLQYPYEFTISGIHKADKYRYQIRMAIKEN